MQVLESVIRDKPFIVANPIKRNLTVLYIIFAVNLVIPLIDLPVFGFSLTAVLFALIFLLLIRSHKIDLLAYRRWIFLVGWIGIAIIVSSAGNGLISGGTDINARGINISIHYLYWILVFVISIYLFTEKIVPIENVVAFCGHAIFGVAFLRLFEAVFWGKIGAWANTRFFTQNSYGFLFSMFAPLAIYLMLQKRKILYYLLNLALLSAVFINGSRGSWIALGSMLAAFLVLLFLSKPSIGNIGLAILVAALILVGYLSYHNFAPSSVRSAVDERAYTFNSLEYDKSFLIRQLMVQKGLRLFQESPIIGVGTARFNYETALLDLPLYLRYGSQQYFNSKSAHNSYIAFLAEQGLFGSIPYAMLIVSLAIGGLGAAVRLLRKNQYWGLGIYLCFISMSVHMWGINSLTNTANWVIYAWVASIIMISKPADLEDTLK